MSASTTDKITDTRNAARPNIARVTSGRSSGGATLSTDDLSGWPTGSKVHFVTYEIDTDNNPVAGTQLDCSGIVSGNDLTSVTVIDGSDNGNSVNDVVAMLPTSAWGQDLSDALLVGHDRTGKHNFSQVIDSNGNETLKLGSTASAVNEVTITNAAASNSPTISATGSDTNININLVPKGTGTVQVGGVSFTGAWQSWTPTYNNFTLGNGTIDTAAYIQIGKTVHFRIKIILGSTSSMGTAIDISLPVTAKYVESGNRGMVGHSAGKVGSQAWYGITRIVSTTTFDFRAFRADGTYVDIQSNDSTHPGSWGSGDYFYAQGTYEAA